MFSATGKVVDNQGPTDEGPIWTVRGKIFQGRNSFGRESSYFFHKIGATWCCYDYIWATLINFSSLGQGIFKRFHKPVVRRHPVCKSLVCVYLSIPGLFTGKGKLILCCILGACVVNGPVTNIQTNYALVQESLSKFSERRNGLTGR